MNISKSFTKEIVVKKQAKLEYLLHLPEDYDETSTFPLVLFLHGKGERGHDLSKVKNQGLPKMSEEKDLPFIMLAPQCPDDIFPYHTWICFLDEVKALVDDIIEKYKVNQKRIYITGLSMGGYGTWEMIQQYPNFFAAAIPICGGGSIKHLDKIVHLPIWTFHGELDNVISISETERLVDYLKSKGSNIRFTRYPEANHDSWTETYNNPQVLEWLCEQENNRID